MYMLGAIVPALWMCGLTLSVAGPFARASSTSLAVAGNCSASMRSSASVQRSCAAACGLSVAKRLHGSSKRRSASAILSRAARLEERKSGQPERLSRVSWAKPIAADLEMFACTVSLLPDVTAYPRVSFLLGFPPLLFSLTHLPSLSPNPPTTHTRQQMRFDLDGECLLASNPRSLLLSFLLFIRCFPFHSFSPLFS